MPEDKILDLLEAIMSHAWQKHMCLQGFRPLKSSIKEFVKFYKQLEFTKDTPTKKGADYSTNQEGQDKSKYACKIENKKQGRSDNKFHCMLHVPNPTYDTQNCRNLKKHAGKLKKKNPCQNNPRKKNSRKTQE